MSKSLSRLAMTIAGLLAAHGAVMAEPSGSRVRADGGYYEAQWAYDAAGNAVGTACSRTGCAAYLILSGERCKHGDRVQATLGSPTVPRTTTLHCERLPDSARTALRFADDLDAEAVFRRGVPAIGWSDAGEPNGRSLSIRFPTPMAAATTR